MIVYVINKHGQPLMPCSQRKARLLLRDKKAKIVNYEPFTIQLLYGSSGYKQAIALGVDAGSKSVGLSATTEEQELYASETTLRNDIVDLLATRSQFRRARRNRKTRYRKARFNNRKRKDGWLAPSVQNKIDTHLKLVAKVHKILPITKIIIEAASFDIQKIKNAEIQGEEYQQGEQLNFWNVREYVLYRDGHVCQHCEGKSKDKILNVHHIESRKTGGDAPNNLITLCETCHELHHKGKITIKAKRGQSLRDATFMGIMRWAFYNKVKAKYQAVSFTYGYLTKHKRIQRNLAKTHATDAFCIANNLDARRTDTCYFQKQVRKQNRQLHKATINKGGKRKANKAPRLVKGFRLFDKVRYDGIECFIFGRRTSGYFDLRRIDGTKVHASASYKKLELTEEASTLLTERSGCVSSQPTRGLGFHAA